MDKHEPVPVRSREVRQGAQATSSPEREARVRLTGVSHRYARTASSAPPVLVDIDLVAAPGEFISIVGPSGCGKSTLLSLVAGLEPATGGRVEVDGVPVKSVRPDVGFVFQKDSLLPWKTLRANAALGLRYRNISRHEAADRAQHWLERMGVGDLGDRYPHQVSGGQRKRAALATTLAYEPQLVLMDEPFSAIDVLTRDYIETDILTTWSESQQRQTFIFVTHDLEEAVALSQRVIVMSRGPGRIIADNRIDLPEPRDVREIRSSEDYRRAYDTVWQQLREQITMTQHRPGGVQ